MPKIGLSKPYIALHGTGSDGAPIYTKRFLAGKYTEMAITPDENGDNAFYADNAEQDNDNSFTGGNVSMTTDDLIPAVMKDIYNLKEVASSSTSGAPKWYVFDDDQEIPHVAVGGVITARINKQTKYQAYIVENVKFNNPEITVATKGENIEWQTSAISGSMFKSRIVDTNVTNPWMRFSDLVDTEAAAVSLVEAYLTVTEPGNGGSV